MKSYTETDVQHSISEMMDQAAADGAVVITRRDGTSNMLSSRAEFDAKEGANKRGNSSRLTQSFHFFMFEPIFSPVNALNQPI
ncbi:hypothetical protein ACN4GA_26885, partial [Raoultella terrigena]